MTSMIVEKEKKGDQVLEKEEQEEQQPKKKMSKFALARLAR